MAERLLVIKGKFVDQTRSGIAELQQRLSILEQKTRKVGGASAQAKNEFQGFVGEQTGKKLGRFNERTEKGRQLLVAFGGAAGGAAGQVVYYGGTLSSVIGTFSKFEIGVMGAVAAVAALGWKIGQELTEQTRKAKERIKELRKETDEYVKSAQSAAMSKWLELLTDEQKIIRERRIALQKNNQAFLEQEKIVNSLRAELEAIQGTGFGTAEKQLEKKIKEEEKALHAIKRQEEAIIEAGDQQIKITEYVKQTKKEISEVNRAFAEGIKAESSAAEERKAKIEAAAKQRQAEAKAAQEKLDAENAQIEAIKQRASIERDLRGFEGTDTEKEVERIRKLIEVEDDRVERVKLQADLERALFADKQARAEAERALAQERVEAQKEADREYQDWQQWHASKVESLERKQAQRRMQALQQGMGQAVAFVRAIEEGRLAEMAKSSALQAIQQWAFFFGATAFGMGDRAGLHLQSAILHTAFAAAAGIGSLAQSGGGKGPSADSGASVTRAQSTGGVQAEEQEQEKNVVYIGNFFESEDANRELAARVMSANQRESGVGV